MTDGSERLSEKWSIGAKNEMAPSTSGVKLLAGTGVDGGGRIIRGNRTVTRRLMNSAAQLLKVTLGY